jgi:hypothetical protein
MLDPFPTGEIHRPLLTPARPRDGTAVRQATIGAAAAAPQWTALFDRTSGWTGADGVYTIPLADDDPICGADHDSRTFITFSDTFIGNVSAGDVRSPGSYLIRNSTALLAGDQPNAASIAFNTKPPVGGVAQPMFANNPNGSWFWPVDGAVVGSDIHMFSLRMKAVSGGFGFDYEGITLFSSTISAGNLQNSPPVFTTYSQNDNTGLFVPAGGGVDSRIFGQALMQNTAESGAVSPDGYIYVYGVRNDFLNKRLITARVPREQIGDISQYRFWNGGAWVTGAGNAQPLTGADHLSSEFSVTPLPDGRYALVFSYDDFLGNRIAVRYGNRPTGPWSAASFIYTCPEDTLTANTFVYGAKAHPSLSADGELLVSYHVNSSAFNELYQIADIYHPRFVSAPLQLTGVGPVALSLPNDVDVPRFWESAARRSMAEMIGLIGAGDPAD